MTRPRREMCSILMDGEIKSGKFIVVVDDKTDDYFLVTASPMTYHNTIFNIFTDDRYFELDYDELVSRIIVRGGGQIKFDYDKKIISVYDTSKYYGKFCSVSVTDVLRNTSDYSGYTLRIFSSGRTNVWGDPEQEVQL